MPSISQQDYIYINVPSLDTEVEGELPVETIKQFYRCVKNGTLMDVVLVSEGGGITRILAFSLNGSLLTLTFYSASEGSFVTWAFVSEPENEEENNEAA